MKKAAMMLLGLLMAGCATVMVDKYNKPYPPREAGAKLDIYDTKKPTVDYIEIAQIKSPDMDGIKKKALELGADAIIMKPEENAKGEAQLGSGFTLQSASTKVAIAIKYKEAEKK